MAGQGPVLNGPPNNLEIRGRRRLNEATFEALMNDLETLLESSRESGTTVHIADCDLSQNKLTKEQFETLILKLASFNVQVQRFRLFGCATLDDEVMSVLAQYVQMIDASTVFQEMHLSDCAITTEGFLTFLYAIEESDAFPYQQGASRLPLYLRVENNYIDEGTIQAKVDEGVIRAFHKTTGSRRGNAAEGCKVDLIVQTAEGTPGRFRQKQGTPPAPEDAPALKPVWDRSSANNWSAQTGAQSGWQTGWQTASGWQKAPVTVPAPQAQFRPQSLTPRASLATPIRPASALIKPLPAGGKPQAVSWPRPGLSPAQQPGAVSTVRPVQVRPPGAQAGAGIARANNPAARLGQFNAFGGAAAGKGASTMETATKLTASTARGSVGVASAGTAVDRSRTPPVRNAKPAKPALPHPWEEHHSDEYGIPYYWNPDTGESLWEKPAEWLK